MSYTSVYYQNAKAAIDYDLLINQGGSSSSKTYSLLQMLLNRFLFDKKGDVTSVVAESIPHIKRGALADFHNIIERQNIKLKENKTDLFFLNSAGAKFEFFSAENPDRLKGGRRKRLLLNEANNISYESYYQLMMRTSGLKCIDYNPNAEFWAHEEIINNPAMAGKFFFLKSTYKDNKFCPASAIEAIEARRLRNPEWYKVFGLGEIGSLDGLVFPSFHIINEIPPEFQLLGAGLDFGYTNHPTAIPMLYKHRTENRILFDEVCYQTGLSNDKIASILKQTKIGNLEIMSDCAEPKSIDEIHNFGLNCKPCVKGKDSINYGIDLMSQFDIYITTRSLNGIKEFRTYKWLTDKNGKATNTPVDAWNHFIDACRYIVTAKLSKPQNIRKPKFL